MLGLEGVAPCNSVFTYSFSCEASFVYLLCSCCPKWEGGLLMVANKALWSHLCGRCYMCEGRISWFSKIKHMFTTHLKNYKVLKVPRFLVLTSYWNQQSTPGSTKKEKKKCKFHCFESALGQGRMKRNQGKFLKWYLTDYYGNIKLKCSEIWMFNYEYQ